MSYRDLEVYQMSEKLAVQVHLMTLKLPKFELYGEGSQIRRSSKGVTSGIVEGYGRRRYVADHVKFLIYALTECDETIQHLRFLLLTKSLADVSLADQLSADYNILSKKINRYILSIEHPGQIR
jgi:four helix bundle protein